MIGIVDYGLGNLTSVAGAVEKLGFEAVISADAAVLRSAERLILPGVGAFGDGMRNLAARGLIEPLNRMVLKERKPILGICLGAQLMSRSSTEFGEHAGLGWIPARVDRLAAGDPDIRIPHVGWNDVERNGPCLLFEEVPEEALFYFVHSYRIVAEDAAIVKARCTYGETFVAAFQARNICGTQFHPEKSQKQGLALLRNFLERA